MQGKAVKFLGPVLFGAGFFLRLFSGVWVGLRCALSSEVPDRLSKSSSAGDKTRYESACFRVAADLTHNDASLNHSGAPPGAREEAG